MKRSLQSIKQRFGIIGGAESLDHALSTAVRVAPTDLTVLITGESGVGKENFSKIIHALSPRKHNNFIAINCGAIPAGTINSELFGHEKGAFTGANTERKGYFETVNTGTIFLDEIGELPLETQSFLLRILENGEYVKVGSSKVEKTDVRIVAATNVDLVERVQNGKFREDLYYRLNTVPIHVPPLRDRGSDVYMLFRYFVMEFSERQRIEPIQLDERARLLLQNYTWPGNIRELKNVAEQVSILSENRLLSAEDLMDYLPNITRRNLPIRSENGNGNTMEEREILYKLLFDMKKDLNDLKGLVNGIIHDNNLDVPDNLDLQQLQAAIVPVSNMPAKSNNYYPNTNFTREEERFSPTVEEASDNFRTNRPIILNPQNDDYQETEVVEESLKLKDMEQDLIQKALKKHNGRRKDAAEDLGISERTLFRKIKEYDLS